MSDSFMSGGGSGIVSIFMWYLGSVLFFMGRQLRTSAKLGLVQRFGMAITIAFIIGAVATGTGGDGDGDYMFGSSSDSEYEDDVPIQNVHSTFGKMFTLSLGLMVFGMFTKTPTFD